MHLHLLHPRRVPWASISELDELCTWIFSDAADDNSKRGALSKLAAWRVATALPHALESTWLILSAILLDHDASGKKTSGSSFLSIRQAYALSIIRMVNGLVDPLQQSLYAKPISYIAAQIGLPHWLVEIRHAATHEDLPSLEVLREAVNQSMKWLLQNYWLPTLNPLEAPQIPPPELPPLAPHLQEYKSLKKAAIKDASLKSLNKNNVNRILQQIERWIGGAKAAWSLGPGRNAHDDEKLSWALDQLCTELLQKGSIVPMSKKKRTSRDLNNSPVYFEIWGQLLLHLQSKYPKFASQLLDRVISALTSLSEDDPSFHACLADWVIWFVENWGNRGVDCTREDALSLLLFEIGKSDSSEITRYQSLIHSLCASDSEMIRRMDSLLCARSHIPLEGGDISIALMEERLEKLHAHLRGQENQVDDQMNEPAQPIPEKNPAPGIRLLGPEDGWRPCPIGINPMLGRRPQIVGSN